MVRVYEATHRSVYYCVYVLKFHFGSDTQKSENSHLHGLLVTAVLSIQTSLLQSRLNYHK